MSDPRKFKNDIVVEGDIQLPSELADKALVIDGTGKIASSAVTTTELSHLSGVTSAVQSQIDSKISSSEKGAANGVATLDGAGKIPSGQLPSYVDDVLEFANLASFPATGSAGIIYVALDTNKTFRWSGSAYIEISPSEVTSVNGQTGVVVLDTDDISEGVSNLYYTDERAQDAVGTILVNSASVDLTYNDVANTITAAVLPAGVDHDQLANFVANEHVDHSLVQIQTAAGTSGLAGGGDITASRSLSVDITGTTAETAIAGGDELLIHDVSAGALRKITRSNLLAGIATTSAGDISESSFSLANNQAVAADVTGLLFAPGVVRSFSALVSVEIDATADLFEQFTLQGINKNGSFNMAVDAVGDNSGVTFSITSGGQVQYTSGNAPGFVSGLIKFRAITTSI